MLELLLLSIIGGAGLSFLFGGDDDGTESVTYDEENGQITGTRGDDVIDVSFDNGRISDLLLDAGDGDDIIDLTFETGQAGGIQNSEIDGGNGDDMITVTYMMDTSVDGGDGDDTITVSAALDGTIDGGAGDDVIIASSVEDGNIFGGDGNDTIYAGRGGASGADFNAFTDGGSGDDTIIYSNEDAFAIMDYGAFVWGGEGTDHFDLTVHQAGGAHSGVNSAQILQLRDFEPGVETIQIETVPDEGSEVTRASLEENTDAGRTNLTITYTHPTEGEFDREITIHATGMTWDDVTFVGETPPATILPLAYV